MSNEDVRKKVEKEIDRIVDEHPILPEVPDVLPDIEDSVHPEIRDIDNIVNKNNDVIPSSDTLGAQGYNPDLGVSSTSSTDIPPVNNPVNRVPSYTEPSKSSYTGLPPRSIDPRETAPDIGKDYGDSLGTPGQGGVQGVNPNLVPQDYSGVNPQFVNPDESLPREGLPEDGDRGLGKKEGLEKKKDDKLEEGLEHGTGKSIRGMEKNPEAPDSSKKPKTDSEIEQEMQQGNGYGALKGKRPNQLPNDGTSNARRNLEHNNRVQRGSQQDSQSSKKSGSQKNNLPKREGTKPVNPGIGSRIKNAIQKGLSKGKSQDSVSDGAKDGKKSSAKESFKSNMKRKLLAFMATHPFAVIVVGILIFILIAVLVSDFENSKNGKRGTHCTYNLSGVTLSGEVELSNLQVELINCDGTASNYTVLETVDFEKYVLGVALAEIGPGSPDEAIKTQIIAARGFALTRNSGMCPGNPDNCFYGYNVSTGKIRMRACEADQVYWDYDKDIYREERGAISIYSPEITSGTLWKSALSEQRKQEVLALAEDVKGKVLVDSTNKVVKTTYVASVSQQFIEGANQGKNHEEILASVYTDSKGFNNATCTSYGNIDYGDYVLSSDGHEILHEPLESFLRKNGTSLEEFNELIADNVEKNGYGTRAGVVTAAVTLIAELGNNYGVKVPYYWGGGHYDGVVIGALGYWGSTQCHTYANNTSYNYCGLDCSGFVPWAIKNGGFNIAQMLAGDFKNMSGVKKVSLSNSPVLEPGDLLESTGHIVLVVGIEESTGNYICAEASGNLAGVLFTRRPFNSSGYWGVKMDGFYDTHVRS